MPNVAVVTGTGVPVPVSSDGTIKVENLAEGRDNKFNITYNLGDEQSIIIGTMDIKIDDDGDVELSVTLIDPYGVITDEATGKAIGEADVTLYYADTDRNKAAGKTPHTVVSLPEIDGFEPDNNKNPQLSSGAGAYGFLVFNDSDCYIVAEKDSYIKIYKPCDICGPGNSQMVL